AAHVRIRGQEIHDAPRTDHLDDVAHGLAHRPDFGIELDARDGFPVAGSGRVAVLADRVWTHRAATVVFAALRIGPAVTVEAAWARQDRHEPREERQRLRVLTLGLGAAEDGRGRGLGSGGGEAGCG